MVFDFKWVFRTFHKMAFHDGLTTWVQDCYHNNTYKCCGISHCTKSAKCFQNNYKTPFHMHSWMLLVTLRVARIYATDTGLNEAMHVLVADI